MSNASDEPKPSEAATRDGTIKVTRDAKSEEPEEKELSPQDTSRDGTPKVTRGESAEQKAETPKNTLRGG